MTNQGDPIVLNYPRPNVAPESVLTQETLERLTASLFSWQQAPGAFGGLHLHSCWGESSVLTRRYHGQTTGYYQPLMDGCLRLYERTGDRRWARLATDIVANLLFLQSREGGFVHASNEFEPNYTCFETCPISQGLPLLALLAYAKWTGSQPELREAIRGAIDAHWLWFQPHFWKCGNAWAPALEFPRWCGVTNQDLTIVAALARYGQVFDDWSRYEEFGLPVLNTYLHPPYYYESLGLFERGDRDNFVERTAYSVVNLEMLDIIHECTGDDRLPRVTENILDHLPNAAFTSGDDGLIHLAWGAETLSEDKSVVVRWIENPRIVASYPPLIAAMRARAKDGARRNLADLASALERTVAAYTFADGAIPGALGAVDALVAVTPGDTARWWRFLIDHLGVAVRSPSARTVVRVHRSTESLQWQSSDRFWAIKRDGERLFAGIKSNPGAVAIGPAEKLPGMDFRELEDAEVLEIVRGKPST
jgi:hypothetical protein